MEVKPRATSRPRSGVIPEEWECQDTAVMLVEIASGRIQLATNVQEWHRYLIRHHDSSDVSNSAQIARIVASTSISRNDVLILSCRRTMRSSDRRLGDDSARAASDRCD